MGGVVVVLAEEQRLTLQLRQLGLDSDQFGGYLG